MPQPKSSKKVMLIGWDAADWKAIQPIMEKGLMPHLKSLMDQGVSGNLRTLQPALSPMLWTSIATGKRPHKHGIHGFSEPDPTGSSIRPISNLSRKSKAIWNILNQEDKRSLVVGWWPSSPAEPINGVMVSNHFQKAHAPINKPWKMNPGTIHPKGLIDELKKLRVHPQELTGDILRYFVPDAANIDQDRDKRLEKLAKVIAECSSIQTVATHLIGKQEWDFSAIYFDAIDHFCHGFMKYHPPRLPWVKKEDYEMYKGVVEGGYIYHDMMLGTLLALAGEDTTIMLISDHGFHPDHLRPQILPNAPAGPASEHRDLGIFVMKGPGIKKGGIIQGATLLDITPTLLTCFGLPMGKDMDGHALESVFEDDTNASFIDSWEDIAGDDGQHPPGLQINPLENQASIAQLVELGYIDAPDEDVSIAIEETVRELRYNLAQSYVDANLDQQAADSFSELWDEWPEESRFGVHLLTTLIKMELPLEARETYLLLLKRKEQATTQAKKSRAELWKKLSDKYPPTKEQIKEAEKLKQPEPKIDLEKASRKEMLKMRRLTARSRTQMVTLYYLEGSVCLLEKRYPEAITLLKKAEAAQTSNLPSLYAKISKAGMQSRNWELAQEYLEKLKAIDPSSPTVPAGLARIAYHHKRYSEVVAYATESLNLNPQHARSRYLLGMSYQHLKQPLKAIKELKNAIALSSGYPAAHRSLAPLLKQQGDWKGYASHLRQSRDATHAIRLRKAGVKKDHAGTTEKNKSLGELQPSAKVEVKLPDVSKTPIIVSGLPRSGTSMMMQMLAAGGVELLEDEHRPADESNQKGYQEYEKAKKLAKDSSWMPDARGKAVKIVAQLLPHLPPEEHYRVIMMHRPLREVINSQKNMLVRENRPVTKMSDSALAQTYKKQVIRIQSVLHHYQTKQMVDVLDIKYNDALTDPLKIAQKIATFLGRDFDVEAAVTAVSPELKRENHTS